MGQTSGVSGRGMQLTERKLEVAEVVKAIAGQAGRSSSQVALNWLLMRDGVTSVILGARKLTHLEDNLGCLDFALDDEQLRRLDEASKIELGFPHDFISSPQVHGVIHGGAEIDGITPLKTSPSDLS